MAVSKNVRFYIRNKKKSTPQPVYLSYFISKEERLFYPTGVKISPKHWDNKLDKVKNVVLPELTTDNKHVHEIARYEKATKDNVNTYLENLRAVVDATVSQCFAERITLSKEILEKGLNNYINPPKAEEKITFFQFIDQYIADLESGKRLIKGNRIADPKTVQRYKTAKNSLEKFQEHDQVSVSWEYWTESTWGDYISYLTFVRKFKINNIGFYQKQLLIFLKAGRKDKLLEADWLDDMTILTENPVDVYLNKKELQKIEEYGLSDNNRLDRIRDLLLVGCNTGFRVSDWQQIHPDNIKTSGEGNKYIEIIPDKENATPPSAPLYPIVERILEKYDGVLPVISDQKFNDYVKELCELIGIDEKLKIKYVKEGRTKIETVTKFSQISSHTCRRSYATNMFLDGVEPYLIMKATGHTSEKNFMKYLKLDSGVSVDAIAEKRKQKTLSSNNQNDER